jgi:hypothetical protein
MAYFIEPLQYFVKPQMAENSHQVVPMQQFVVQQSFPVQIGMQIGVPFQPIHIGGMGFIQTTEKYDYAFCLILTKDQNGTLQLLLPVNGRNYINLYEQKVYNSDNPDTVIQKSMSFYGISVNSKCKFTNIKHVEKSNNMIYKIGVLYIPQISCSIVNNHFQTVNGFSHRIERVNLKSNYNYYCNLTISNIIYAMYNMKYSLI